MSQQDLTTEQQEQQNFRLIPKGFSMIVMLGVLVGFFAFISLWQPWQPVDSVQRKQQITQATVEDEQLQTHYEFYDLLAKQKVSPMPDKPLTTAPDNPLGDSSMAVMANSSQDRVQPVLIIKSFNNADAADKQRSRIRFANLPADVIIEKNEQGRPLYRVIAGPFPNKQLAVQAKTHLEKQGIDSILSEIARKQAE